MTEVTTIAALPTPADHGETLTIESLTIADTGGKMVRLTIAEILGLIDVGVIPYDGEGEPGDPETLQDAIDMALSASAQALDTADGLAADIEAAKRSAFAYTLAFGR